MKFTIDLTKKEITLHSSVQLRAIIEQLDSMFPNKEWMDWEVKQEDTFSNPYQYTPSYPFTIDNGTGTIPINGLTIADGSTTTTTSSTL